MTQKHERPVGLFIFVQVMGLCAMVIAGVPLLFSAFALVRAPFVGNLPDDPWLLVQYLCALGAGACLMWLLAEFVSMCGRVRKETAFTAENVKALGRIALAFLIGGGLLLAAGELLMTMLLIGMRGFFYEGSVPFLWYLLPAFAAWTAALLVRAIQVLMKRAVDMQTESDLTV